MASDSPTPKTGRRGVVRVQRARCTVCGSRNLRIYGGVDQADGSRLQYAKCRACDAKLLVILE